MGANTKISWCESTWSPITGCLHSCEYCYARKIAERFGGSITGAETVKRITTADGRMIWDLLKPIHKTDGKISPYPCGFVPTFHRYKLDEPQKWKKGRNIFVCSMADLFGSWVPDSWIEEVFVTCEKAPQHNYLFLTKNPNGIQRSSNIYNGVFGRHSDNFWFGTTVTCQKDLEDRLWPLLQVQGHCFLSIEPILSKLDLDCIWVSEKNKGVMLSLPKKTAYYLGGAREYHMPEWVIIGAETGSRKEKVVPKMEWIESIVRDCRKADIPVFMKESLADIWGEPLIQEYPEGLKKGALK